MIVTIVIRKTLKKSTRQIIRQERMDKHGRLVQITLVVLNEAVYEAAKERLRIPPLELVASSQQLFESFI